MHMDKIACVPGLVWKRESFPELSVFQNLEEAELLLPLKEKAGLTLDFSLPWKFWLSLGGLTKGATFKTVPWNRSNFVHRGSAKSAWLREPTSETSTSVHGLALGSELCFMTKHLSRLKTLLHRITDSVASLGSAWLLRPTAKAQQRPWANLLSLQFRFACQCKQGIAKV